VHWNEPRRRRQRCQTPRPVADLFLGKSMLKRESALGQPLARHCATRSCHSCCRSCFATIFSAIVEEAVWLAESSNHR
jgi:hypothetical protein